MKRNFSKTKTASITLILMLTFSAIFVALPIVSAQDSPGSCKTYAFLSVAPNPVGVGQTVIVSVWLSNLPLLNEEGWAVRWEDYVVTIEKPDGTTQTLGPSDSDPIGSQWFQYVPDAVGTYTFQFSFPGQTAISGVYYEPSTSQKVELTVQEEQIEYIPATPLPTNYWERPINTENRDWGQIAGNWLMSYYNGRNNPFNPYTKTPNAGHIVWTKEIDFGGIVGGDSGNTAYYSGESYENKWNPPVIMNGILYYNKRLGSSSWLGVAAVNLRTGEELWFKNGTTISYGQLNNYESPNQHGVIPYLWSVSGSTYHMYDAFTGEWILDIENVPRGSTVFGPHGELLVYILDGQNKRLAMWNSSSIPELLGGTTGTNAWQWRPPQGATLDGMKGIQWNVTITDVPGSPTITWVFDDVIVATAYSPEQLARGLYVQEGGWMHYGFSLKPGQEGQLLWAQNHTITGNRTIIYGGARGTAGSDGIWTAWLKETMQYIGFDAYTGDQLWITEPYENSWGMYQMGAGAIAYGKFYTAAFDGRVHAYDLTTGEEVWTYFTGSSGLETPYGQYPFCAGITGSASVLAVADGKVYAINNEHSPSMPLFKGYKLHVMDAETGKSVWNITGWYQHPVIADGYVVTLNAADNQIYCFGKGSSKTTVTVQDDVIANGDSVLIKGTVTDESSGTKKGAPAVYYPNGVPAVSDASQERWMEYLYMQQPKPADAKGVEVHLTAIDPNGNFQDIGYVTTDLNGNFGKMWTPPVPGEYHITASFEGSESYWSSDATTYFGVEEAPSAAQQIEPEQPAAPAPTEPTTASTEAPLITTETAIIAAVAVACIIGAAAFWAIRKRK